jgi:hypothetical protein
MGTAVRNERILQVGADSSSKAKQEVDAETRVANHRSPRHIGQTKEEGASQRSDRVRARWSGCELRSMSVCKCAQTSPSSLPEMQDRQERAVLWTL